MAAEDMLFSRLRDSARSLWCNASFRRFWLANFVSNLGTSAYVMALSWLTVKAYGSAGIAAISLAYGLPQFLFEILGGAAADRICRRRLFQLTETAFLLAALLLWLASMRGSVPLWFLVVVTACNGVISAFDSPARSALISEMVPAHQLVDAAQIYSISANITNIFGPALGALLLSVGTSEHSHEEMAFLFNVLSFLPLLALIPFMVSGRSVSVNPQRRTASFWHSVAEGLHFVRGRSDLRALLQMLAVVMVLGMPFQGLLPIFVHGHHGMGASQGHGYYAALLSAVGFGGLVGSLLGLVVGLDRRPGLPLLSAAAGLAVSILMLTASDVIHWASLAAFFAGTCGVLVMNLDMALLQGFSPAPLQGRVAAIASLGKGMQSFSTAAASGLMHILAARFIGFSTGYGPVQIAMAAVLLMLVLLLWRPLQRIGLAPLSGSGPT